jgi:hypothetical protein
MYMIKYALQFFSDWLHYSRNWREADRGRLWAYKWRFKQPLLVHISLMICPLTCVPNPPCQLSLWEETGVPGENPRLSAERCLFTLFAWGLGSSHIEKFSLRLEPAILEVKDKYINHLATEAPFPFCSSHALHTTITLDKHRLHLFVYARLRSH